MTTKTEGTWQIIPQPGIDDTEATTEVVVIDPKGRARRIHIEDADPEHRETAVRIAAAYFGNRPAGNE